MSEAVMRGWVRARAHDERREQHEAVGRVERGRRVGNLYSARVELMDPLDMKERGAALGVRVGVLAVLEAGSTTCAGEQQRGSQRERGGGEGRRIWQSLGVAVPASVEYVCVARAPPACTTILPTKSATKCGGSFPWVTRI